MMQELRRLWTSPVTWLLALGPITLNGTLALFQRRYGPEHYWSFVGLFWDKLGLAAVAALVLTICLSLMSCDKSCRTEALMLTTRLGRKHLFLRRLLACALCPFLLVLLLSAGNLLCGLALSGGLSIPSGPLPIWVTPFWQEWVGLSCPCPPAGCANAFAPLLSPFCWRLWCWCSAPWPPT